MYKEKCTIHEYIRIKFGRKYMNSEVGRHSFCKQFFRPTFNSTPIERPIISDLNWDNFLVTPPCKVYRGVNLKGGVLFEHFTDQMVMGGGGGGGECVR